MGLFTVDCITLPHIERPAPIIRPNNTRGNLMFHTMARVDLETSPISRGNPNLLKTIR